MNELTYFVSFKLYNSENKGWAYKIETKTTDLGEAERKYGELIKTYWGTKPFAFGSISITDQFDNSVENTFWNNTNETPEEVTE